MKGLLLKDFYTITTHFRFYLILTGVFIVGSAIADLGIFVLYFPCILSGVITMSIIACEESERWQVYAATLPCSRSTLVSVKYIVAILFSAATVLSAILAQLVGMLVRNSPDIAQLGTLALTLLTVCLLPNAILLPFVFRFGANRGRLVYYALLGFFVAVTTVFDMPDLRLPGWLDARLTAPLLLVAAVGVFTLSWFISTRVYRKREF